MADEEGAAYGLLVSFKGTRETFAEEVAFTHGFEAGRIDRRMESGTEAEIEVTTRIENREVLRRMAVAAGWSIDTRPSDVEGWDFTKLIKVGKAPERPNPRGLRVVPHD